MSPLPPARAKLAVSLALAVLVIVAFAGVAQCGFINVDDGDYVTQNPHVQRGLTWSGFVWALTTGHSANWHPLTWLSHMLDCQLAGTTPALPHLENLLFHLASTLLLFRLLARTTGAIGPSAFVAAAFGLHPLHVESVAWVAERKDVLSAFLAMLTMHAYVRWVEAPRTGRRVLVAVLYALGLLAKPMLVTLPFVLLLLDVWPLRRARGSFLPRCLEKADLFALAAASSVATFLVQRTAGAMTLTDRIPFLLRAENAVVSWATYLGKSLFPVDLVVFYPHPAASYPAGRLLLSAAVVAGLTVLALSRARSRPWIAVGWLWFLGMLVPVIGLVQVGSQAMADRYTYLPMIGLSIAVGFEAAAIARRSAAARTAVASLFVLAVATWTWRTIVQVGYWRSDRDLFGHSVEVMPDNYFAHAVLGNVHLRERRFDLAMEEYRESLRLRPTYAEAHSNMGMAFELSGRPDQAIDQYRTALRLSPALAEAHHNLGRLLATRGDLESAIPELEAAVRSNPNLVEAHLNLGVALLRAGRREEGIASLRRATELRPGYPEAMRVLEKAGVRP